MVRVGPFSPACESGTDLPLVKEADKKGRSSCVAFYTSRLTSARLPISPIGLKDPDTPDAEVRESQKRPTSRQLSTQNRVSYAGLPCFAARANPKLLLFCERIAGLRPLSRPHILVNDVADIPAEFRICLIPDVRKQSVGITWPIQARFQHASLYNNPCLTAEAYRNLPENPSP